MTVDYGTHRQSCTTSHQWINEMIDRSINQSIKQSSKQSIKQTIHQAINQSSKQSINQSSNQSINQAIHQAIDPSINLLITHVAMVCVTTVNSKILCCCPFSSDTQRSNLLLSGAVCVCVSTVVEVVHAVNIWIFPDNTLTAQFDAPWPRMQLLSWRPHHQTWKVSNDLSYCINEGQGLINPVGRDRRLGP